MCVVSDAEWTAVQERVAALTPERCPECGSTDILPTFLAPFEWECVGCFAVWSMNRDE